ncbi:hypothetical protein OF829_16310 [Sphingomonas sp. LB-2]|uniref:hypothetical protein n=1 Tax=Sphingomonas caeni TaxID=2984949 RepID=UPI002231F755|nr:hypothetical protein [Sphingomonas caeni]MCW3848802.1 hypothetical protein [Sphingomonas caeni]
MSKSIIIAAAVSALVVAAPAFAQNNDCAATAGRGHVKVFDGNNGPISSATASQPSTVRGFYRTNLGREAAPTSRGDGFDGPHGSASNLRDRPSSDPTEARPPCRDGFDGPHGSATNLRDRPSGDPTAGRRPAFNGPHGSASDLRDRPSGDPTALGRPVLHGRKAGADEGATGGRPRAQPSSRPTTGLTKTGAGTLQY